MALPGGRAIHKLTNSKKCKKLTQPYFIQFYDKWASALEFFDTKV